MTWHIQIDFRGLAALLYSTVRVQITFIQLILNCFSPWPAILPLWSSLASPPPPSPSIRGPVCLQTSLQPGARSAPTGWRRCSGPGPGWTACSGSSCWSTCRLTPPAPGRRRSTPWWPPLVAVVRETQKERETQVWITRLKQQKFVRLQEETKYREMIYWHPDSRMHPVQSKRERTHRRRRPHCYVLIHLHTHTRTRR